MFSFRKNRLVFFLLLAPLITSAQSGSAIKDTSRMAWFNQAKFGIFLHWGVFSAGKAGASWPMFSGAFSVDDYLAQGKEFTASNYDPQKWAELFKAAGAKYAVLTAMHCDGVTLWPSKAYKTTSIQKISPYKKDLIGPYCNALKDAGLKVGLYYSHVDWANDDYMTLTQNLTNQEFDDAKKVKYNYQKNWELKNKEGYYNQKKFTPQERTTWDRFIKRHNDQVNELANNYKIDLLWFDFMYPNSGDFKWNEKQLRADLVKDHPQLIVNGRISSYGDYDTPEKGMPIIPPAGPWELCETMNNNWSYVANDHDNKTVRQMLRMLVECVSMGGNLLLGIGPKPDGSIDPEQEKRLLEMGKWINSHQEAIYETKRGILPGHFYGPTSLSLDGKPFTCIYLTIRKTAYRLKGLKTGLLKVWPLSVSPMRSLR